DRVEALPASDPPPPRSEPIDSGHEVEASGTIGGAELPPASLRSEESLVAELADGNAGRVEAAVELGQRGHPSAIEPVFAAIASMTRTEASAALASAIGFGSAATPKLLEGLASRKAY